MFSGLRESHIALLAAGRAAKSVGIVVNAAFVDVKLVLVREGFRARGTLVCCVGKKEREHRTREAPDRVIR